MIDFLLSEAGRYFLLGFIGAPVVVGSWIWYKYMKSKNTDFISKFLHTDWEDGDIQTEV